MYMSYCRCEGTLHEMRAVLEDVEYHIHESAPHRMSDGEIQSFKSMVTEFVNWINDMGLLEDEVYLDDEELDRVCYAMAHGYEEDDG